MGESIRRESSNSKYPLDATARSPMPRNVVSSDDRQFCSGVEMGHISDGKSTRSHTTTTEASGNDRRGSSRRAKRKTQLDEIDELFQGLT